MSAKSEKTIVQEWLAVIRIAIDEDSPFAGMVQLHQIFDLPISTQCLIYDALSGREKYRLKELYGPKGGAA